MVHRIPFFVVAFAIPISGCHQVGQATTATIDKTDNRCPAEISVPPAKGNGQTDRSNSGEVKPIRVAITFDDLPVHGPISSGLTRLEIHQSILNALTLHKVPGVVGFINGKGLDDGEDARLALKAWVDAGYPLGNHTYSHPHASRVPVEEYLTDIQKNEPILRSFYPTGSQEADWKYFRYPYLAQGGTLERRGQIREWLFQHEYKITHTSIDFADWAWNDSYIRCRDKGQQESVQALSEAFLSHSIAGLEWSDAAAQKAFGRKIPHILLMHIGAMDALILDKMLTAYEEHGVEFISVDQALEDPVYHLDLPTANEWDGTILDQYIRTRNAEHPPWPTRPESLLDAICR